jgi:hypothetical protein
LASPGPIAAATSATVGGFANSRREPSGKEIVIIGAFLAGNKKARQSPRLSVWGDGRRERAADQASV